MLRVPKLLLLLGLTVLVSFVYFGCEQPEDVLTTISHADITLIEERLPTSPDGTLYELWVANSSDTVSLGKFGYDFDTRKYYDGANIKSDSNKFEFNGNINNYEVLFISVELIPDTDNSSPGSIMLIDYLASPTIKLRFPNVDSLWDGTIRYSMETPSNGIDTDFDGYGVWFATYEEITIDFNDTFLIDDSLDWYLDSGAYVDAISGCIESNVIYALEDIIQKDTAMIFGLDTDTHSVVRFNVVESTKTCDYYPTHLTINYNETQGTVIYDRYTQDEFALPDISPYGWKYKGWVVSPYIDSNLTGSMTLPAWIIYGNEFDESTGGMFTTGTFSDVTTADDGNPYTVSDRVPDYPGEDFLQNLPGGMSPVNLVPNQFGNPGMVFVSLEPIGYTANTNFPLLAFVDKQLPQAREFVTSSDIIQMFTLRGWMSSSDPYRGFPKITVEIETF
jgi:hypothetical protein